MVNKWLLIGIVGALLTGAALALSFVGQSSMSVMEFSHLYGSAEYPVQYSKRLGEYEVKVKYRPLEYHVARFSRNDKQIYDSLMEVNDSIIFLDFKVAGLRQNSPLFEGRQELLEERLMYFLTHITEDLVLSDSHGTYTLLNHSLERNYNITNALNLQLAFKKPQERSFTFTFNDRMLNIGKVNFMVNERDLEKLPHIKF